MSVIMEFTVESEGFSLGQALSGPPEMHVELERIVPTGNTVLPFLWVTGDEFEAFEERVRSHPLIEEFVALERVEASTLYRVQWRGDHNDLVGGITEAEGTILEAEGDEEWTFHLRFGTHDNLSTFYNYCTDHDIPITIRRTYTLSERTQSVRRYDLSQQQREALLLGLRKGYFDTPSEVSLSELAAELDISQQAVSNRIRRGTKKVLDEALLSSNADLD